MPTQLALFSAPERRMPEPGVNVCYTLGYQGLRDGEQIVTIANALGATVADIRYMPYTKNPMWHRMTLRKLLQQRYAWIEALGNRAYRSHDGTITIDDWPLGMQKLQRLLAKGPVILLCACAEPHKCHRDTVLTQAHIQLGATTWHLTRADINRLTEGGDS